MDLNDIKEFSPELAKLIIDHLDGVVVTDAQGRYIYVNEAWSEMMGGLKLKDIKGKYVHDIVPDTKIDYVLKSKKPVIGHPIITKGPEKTQAFSSYFPIFKDGELVAGFIHVFMKGIKDALDFSFKVNSMANQIEYYKQELRKIRGAKYTIDNIIGNSKKIVNMKKQIINAARSNSTVLIEGETGTGKELVAHSIHDLSTRSSGPFIKVNCAAIPRELLESEFFGYEEGAFTGAKKGGKEGRFEMANGGSLFLDEINQMPLTLQPKLLRALQEKEIERVGGKESIPIDVRIIAASNMPLEKLVQEKKFRLDLYYRLNVIKITIPPLRQRREDIPLILDDLLDKLNFQLGMNVPGIFENVKNKLMNLDYDWPGNVRELQNVLERAMNKSWGEKLEWEHFSDYFDNKTLKINYKPNNSNGVLIRDMKKALEKDTIIKVLQDCNYNKTKAAEMLGISRTWLYKKIKEYEIDIVNCKQKFT